MGFKCGIVGLPNVGKSTLFNALTKTAAAQAANYPFCTIEPNVGEVAMPEPRLDKLAAIAKSKEIIPTRMNFVDIAGLVRGASKGEGLGNQFLANIRECDAIAYVLRCFENDDITHVEGRIDPIADLETVETELMLADLESLEKRITNLEKKAKGGDKEAKLTLDLVLRAKALLEDGKPARHTKRAAEEEKALRDAAALDGAARALRLQRQRSATPPAATRTPRACRSARSKSTRRASIICAQLEAEIAALIGRRAGRIPGRPSACKSPASPSSSTPATICSACRPTSPSARKKRAPGPSTKAGPRRKPPASSTAISKKASSAPKPSPTTTSSPSTANRRQGSRQDAA